MHSTRTLHVSFNPHIFLCTLMMVETRSNDPNTLHFSLQSKQFSHFNFFGFQTEPLKKSNKIRNLMVCTLYFDAFIYHQSIWLFHERITQWPCEISSKQQTKWYLIPIFRIIPYLALCCHVMLEHFFDDTKKNHLRFAHVQQEFSFVCKSSLPRT